MRSWHGSPPLNLFLCYLLQQGGPLPPPWREPIRCAFVAPPPTSEQLAPVPALSYRGAHATYFHGLRMHQGASHYADKDGGETPATRHARLEQERAKQLGARAPTQPSPTHMALVVCFLCARPSPPRSHCCPAHVPRFPCLPQPSFFSPPPSPVPCLPGRYSAASWTTATLSGVREVDGCGA